MTVVRVKGFKIFDSRHRNGKQYCYHRKTGERIDLEKHPIGCAGFLAECARINALAIAATPKPGTLGMLIEAYRSHAAFTELAPRTRVDYQRVFDYLRPSPIRRLRPHKRGDPGREVRQLAVALGA
jgi:hypothetical protein